MGEGRGVALKVVAWDQIDALVGDEEILRLGAMVGGELFDGYWKNDNPACDTGQWGLYYISVS